MRSRFFLALSLVLLVLGNEVQGTQEDEPGSMALLETVQGSLLGYWISATEVAKDLYQKTYPTSMDEKLRDMYSKSSAAMSTYAGIFTDQLFTLLRGE
ncbi:apolipoprotein C-II [Mastomys coucha]|uniref:apolipoprotein C-II n=1 Tax=Mastomys coucha TaxID=35658 RepID=UPI001261F79A|nr:apolipoprotein C-II [Mastomys coucha]XP_031240065.1 apolipoprotein C-II [Mastomys coucha]XP_031240066.1 apolipoprotein C-II [Mastomys coucha]